MTPTEIAALLDQAEAVDANERDLTAFARTLPADVAPALRAATTDRRAEAFTAILLAALHRGDALDASPFFRAGSALLPDVATLAAASGRLTGPVGQCLVDAAGDGKLGWDLEACALLLAAFWGRKRGVEDPPELLRRARVLARKAPGGLADIALAGLLGLTDDAGLEAGLGPSLDETLREEARDLAEGLVERFLGPVLESVPETRGTRYSAHRPLQRASEKVGRNQPCPCGSGKKYKHCHERLDAARNDDASEVAGLTRAELRRQEEPHLTAGRLDELRAHELARLDPTRIPRDLVPHWLDRLCFHREWAAIEGAVAALDDPELDEALVVYAGDAAWNGDRDAANRLLAHFHGDDPPLRAWARAALSDDPAETARIAEDAAREHLDQAPLEAAYALMRSPFPALGLLAARSVLPHLEFEDAEPLLAEILDTREAMGLEPWDPVEDVLYKLTHGHDAAVVQELTAAERRLQTNQAQLQGASAELRALREQLAAKEAERSSAPSVVTEVVIRPKGEDPETRALRERVASLKDELKERHSERNALRRELQEIKEQAEAEPDEPAPANTPAFEPEDDDVGLEATDAQHDGKLRLPTWSSTFADTLTKVPPNVARAAVDKLCQVAVGNQGAFVEVRRLRGREWLWRAKVGRSYRLLFRVDDDGIEALDLVHRQDLEKRIKQLGG